MKQLIEHFDKAYIINLSDRVDRRRQAEREFNQIGINIPNERVKFFTAFRPESKGNFQDIGTRGCFESHRNILEIAVRSRLNNLLIFEDDVSFRDIDAEPLQRLIEEMDGEDWDVIFFAYLKPTEDFLDGPLKPWSGDILGAHFYGLNGNFIPKVLQYMKDCEQRRRDHPDGGPMPADGIYNHIRQVIPNVKLFIAAPSLALQRSSRTDISRLPLFDKIELLAPIMRCARALKHHLRMSRDRKKLRPR